MTTSELIARLKKDDPKGSKDVTLEQVTEIFKEMETEPAEESGATVVSMEIQAAQAVEVGHRDWKPGQEVDPSWQPDDFPYYDSYGIAIPLDARLVVEYSDGSTQSFALDDGVAVENKGAVYDLDDKDCCYLYGRMVWNRQTWRLSGFPDDLKTFDPAKLHLTASEVPDLNGGTDSIVSGISYAVPGDPDDLWSDDEVYELECELLGGDGSDGITFAVYRNGEWTPLDDDGDADGKGVWTPEGAKVVDDDGSSVTLEDVNGNRLEFEVVAGGLSLGRAEPRPKGELVLPAKVGKRSVVQMGTGCLQDCTGLTGIVVPASVRKIDGYALFGCTALRELVLSDGLEEIGPYAFGDCTSLESLTLPDSVGKLGVNAFDGCSALKSVKLPDGLQSLSQRAFANCASLVDVAMPSELSDMWCGVFENCTSLEEVVFPETFEIGDLPSSCFEGCSSLKRVCSAGAGGDDPDLTAEDLFLPEGVELVYLGRAAKAAEKPAKAKKPAAAKKPAKKSAKKSARKPAAAKKPAKKSAKKPAKKPAKAKKVAEEEESFDLWG